MSTKSLALRWRQPEWMDQPGLDKLAHRKALDGLQRVNGLCRIRNVLWRAVCRVAQQRQLNKVRVLDLACGGGDFVIWLAHRGLREGIDFSVDGCDISQNAVAYAKEKAHAAGAENTCFFVGDALSESFAPYASKKYDIVMCSLFLHHLEEEQTVALLRRMANRACHAVIIDDLRRTRLGYGLAWIGCRLLTRSPIVHQDGPMSVQGAYTVEEARWLAEKAGLQNVKINTHWPQRFLLTWQRTLTS